MVITHGKTKSKASGKKKKQSSKKRLCQRGHGPMYTKLGPVKKKSIKTKGGGRKRCVMTTDSANVFDSKSKRWIKAKIITIVENPANRHYVRRNIMTKGTIIETDKGKARITGRPGQEGSVNAVLV